MSKWGTYPSYNGDPQCFTESDDEETEPDYDKMHEEREEARERKLERDNDSW